MFKWFRKRRRKKILQAPFPSQWHAIVTQKVQHYSYLDEEERHRLQQLVQIFIAEKQFEGCGGLESVIVYHEFAHVLDMRDGSADGTPILYSRKLYRAWVETCSREYAALKEETRKGKRSVLDSYGSVNEAEFFAVATELFFDRPLRMKKDHLQLYKVLSHYYRQDTAAREQRFRSNQTGVRS